MIDLTRGFLMTLEMNPDKTFTLKDLKKAYHKLAMKNHPDKFNQEEYDTYREEHKKYTTAMKKWHEEEEEYEEHLKWCEEKNKDPDREAPKIPDEPERVLTEQERGEEFKKVHHAYKMLTDPSYRANEKIRHNGGGQVNLHAVINVAINFEQGFFGDKTTLTFNPIHIDDKGQAVKLDLEKDVHMDVDVIKVTIPPGTRSGDKILVKKKGLKQKDRRGDLVFVFQVSNHPQFQYHPKTRNDVVSKMQIPLDIMITGGEIEVPTMWGLKSARIPAGSIPGLCLLIPKAGIEKVGTHHVTIDPVYPDKKDLKANTVWQKLGIDWKEQDEKDDEEDNKEKEFSEIFDRLQGGTSAGSTLYRFD